MRSQRVAADGEGKRLDVFLAVHDESLSRSHAHRLIAAHRVHVDGLPAKPAHRLRAGEVVSWCRPEPEPLVARAEAMPLDIVYEDEYVVVVNKARGMVVHPAAGHRQGTLVNALLHHCQDLSGINDVLRPGIVHRLDKDTTGLLVVGKSEAAMQFLMREIKERHVIRRYMALVHGVLKAEEGEICAPIGRHPHHRKRMAVLTAGRGRHAITRYKVVERFLSHTLVGAELLTGRTHQIRVHMAHLGHPLAGDAVYAGRRDGLGLGGQALHAHHLGFRHPASGDFVEFTAPLPDDFQEVVRRLRSQR